MHRHQGGLALFVLDGRGHTIVNGVTHDWEAGDLILLPVAPGASTTSTSTTATAPRAGWR